MGGFTGCQGLSFTIANDFFSKNVLICCSDNATIVWKTSNLASIDLQSAHSLWDACFAVMDLWLKTSFVMFQANAASAGMSVSDECTMKFMELKRKRTYWYIISKIDEKLQQFTLEKTGDPGVSYEDFNCTNFLRRIADMGFMISTSPLRTTDRRAKSFSLDVKWFILWFGKTEIVKSFMLLFYFCHFIF